jgi:hypothetical protein
VRDVVRVPPRSQSATHNATVVRSHGAVVVETEWARRVVGWSQAAISERDPGEEEGDSGIMLCWMGGCCRANKSLHVGMEGRWSGQRAVL